MYEEKNNWKVHDIIQKWYVDLHFKIHIQSTPILGNTTNLAFAAQWTSGGYFDWWAKVFV